MSEMKRRRFLKEIGLGSAAVMTGSIAGSQASAQNHGNGHGPGIDGPLASATVAFGAWPASRNAPLDRTETPVAPIAPNVHELIPSTVMIKAGGAVNYVVAGFHQIVVYAPGKEPSDVNTDTLLPIPDAPPEIGLIDDPEMRIYRGPDPADLPQDRVEVVHFDRRGLYLVICSVNIHFEEGMYGWVLVVG